jgi:transcriptional regulator with XRE-family HTH domain
MLNDGIDLTEFGERLASVRRAYGDHIDLSNLGRSAFASLLGVSAIAYEAYERGEIAPTDEFLARLCDKTGIDLNQDCWSATA